MDRRSKFEFILPFVWIVMSLIATILGDYPRAYGFLGIAAYFMVMFRLDEINRRITKFIESSQSTERNQDG